MKSNLFLRKIPLTDSLNLQSGAPSLGSEKRWGERKSLGNLSGDLQITWRCSQEPIFGFFYYYKWLVFIAVNAFQMPSTPNTFPTILGIVFVPTLVTLWSPCPHSEGVPAVTPRIHCPLGFKSHYSSPCTLWELFSRCKIKPAKAECHCLKHLTNLWDASRY